VRGGVARAITGSARRRAPLQAIKGGIWLRISAHAYNEIEDYERLAELSEGCDERGYRWVHL